MPRYSVKPKEYKDFIELPSITEITDPISFPSTAASGWATKVFEEKIYSEIDKLGRLSHDKVKDIIKNSRFTYKEESDIAKDTGSIVHSLIERHIKKTLNIDLKNYSDQVQNSFNAFLAWEKFTGIQWLESEKTIYLIDPESGLIYGGTLDTTALLFGRIDVLDFKSSKKFYPDSMVPQISAYKYARILLNGMSADIKRKDEKSYIETYESYDIQGMGVIRLDKETGYPEYKDYTKNYDRGFESFGHLCRYYYSAKKRRLKNNPLAK